MSPTLEHALPIAVLAGLGLLVVLRSPFGKAPSSPALHPRGRDRNQVDSTDLYRSIPTYHLETLPAEHLARPRDVVSAREPIIVAERSLAKGGTGDTESGISHEPVHQELVAFVAVHRHHRGGSHPLLHGRGLRAAYQHQLA